MDMWNVSIQKISVCSEFAGGELYAKWYCHAVRSLTEILNRLHLRDS
jgi:hypothetical protein